MYTLPLAQSFFTIAAFGFWGEIAGTALASVTAVVAIQKPSAAPKRLQN